MELRIALPPLYKWENTADPSPEEVERRLSALPWDEYACVMLRQDAEHRLEAGGSREYGFSLKYRDGGEAEFILARALRTPEKMIAALRSYAAGDGQWKTMLKWKPFDDERSAQELAYYDGLIHKAVQGRSEADSAKPEDILHLVDAYDRSVLDRKAFEGGLRRLIASGKIAETGRLRFYDPQGLEAPRTFDGLSEDEYERAVEDYHALFQRLSKESEGKEDEFPRLILTVRWAFAEKPPTEEDFARMEELARKIDAVLDEKKLATVNGFEVGNDVMEMQIFGPETDAHTDEVYDSILSVFRVFPNPPGSCLVRHYVDGTDRVSDEVK